MNVINLINPINPPSPENILQAALDATKIPQNNFFKGTSRGPEALQSHLNDSYYTN